MNATGKTSYWAYDGAPSVSRRRLAVWVAGAARVAALVGAAGLAHAQAVIDDPIAYWSFDDTGSVLANRVTSSPYHDASVLFGQPTAGLADGASGVAGNALMLDGATGLRLPYHQDNLGTSFTLSLWYWQLTNDTRQCVYQTRDNFTATYEAMPDANTNFAAMSDRNSPVSLRRARESGSTWYTRSPR